MGGERWTRRFVGGRLPAREDLGAPTSTARTIGITSYLIPLAPATTPQHHQRSRSGSSKGPVSLCSKQKLLVCSPELTAAARISDHNIANRYIPRKLRRTVSVYCKRQCLPTEQHIQGIIDPTLFSFRPVLFSTSFLPYVLAAQYSRHLPRKHSHRVRVGCPLSCNVIG